MLWALMVISTLKLKGKNYLLNLTNLILSKFQKETLLDNLMSGDWQTDSKMLLEKLKQISGENFREFLSKELGLIHLVATDVSIVAAFVNPEKATKFAEDLSQMISGVRVMVIDLDLNGNYDLMEHARYIAAKQPAPAAPSRPQKPEYKP